MLLFTLSGLCVCVHVCVGGGRGEGCGEHDVQGA